MIKSIFVGGDFGFKRLVTSPLGVDRFSAAVGLVLCDNVLLLDPFGKLLAVLQKLLKLKGVAEFLHQLDGSLAVSLSAFAYVFSLALGFVGREMALILQALGKLDHVIHLVIVGVHRGKECFVAFDGILCLLQIGWHFILQNKRNVRKTFHQPKNGTKGFVPWTERVPGEPEELRLALHRARTFEG